MLSLTKTKAPEAVKVDGVFYTIHTDYRYWISFSKMIQEKHFYYEYDFLYLEEKPEDREKGFNALLEFYADKNLLPRIKAQENDKKVLDYELDADLIFSAFYEVYGIDLTETNLHWYKFKALLNGLHGTKLNEIISYRLYDENEKSDYKKSMIESRQMWELPEIITEEEQKAIDEFDAKLQDSLS